MLIKSKHKNSLKGLSKKRPFFQTRLWRWSKRLLVVCFIVGLFVGGMVLGMKFNEGRGYAPATLINKMTDRFNAPEFGKGFDALAAKAEKINVNIKAEDMQRLYFHRAEALKGNRIFDYVPATITAEGKTIPVKIKLKGDRETHWEDIKQMSFRVKGKGDNTLFGIKKFSLQKPRTKNYIYEWLFHKCLEREGILGLRYKFVTMSLNGDDLGTYAIEEHFEKRLVESQERREGPIVRMVEGPAYNFYTAPVEPYDGERWSAPGKIEIVTQAVNQMNAWRNGELKTSQAFDVGMLARYFALSDVLGAEHGTIWKSVKFYFNPITGKLEPIGVDAQLRFGYDAISSEMGLRTDIGYINEKYDDWYNHLFVNEATFDPVFYQAYIKELERMSQTAYLDTLFSEIRDELDMNQALIYKDFPLLADHITHYGPDFYRFSEQQFYAKQKYLRYKLDAMQGIQAYYHHADSKYIYLDVGNITTLPIHLKNARFGLGGMVELDSFYRLPAKHIEANITFSRVRVPLPDTVAWTDSMAVGLRLRFAVFGREKYKGQLVYPWKYVSDMASEGHFMTLDSLNLDQPFLEVDHEASTIVFKLGGWKLDQPVIMPPGYHVFCREGVTIDLTNNASIISRSPWMVVGQEFAPVIFTSSDSTGQGIFLLDCKENSVFSHTIFSNLSNLKNKGWGIYGAVNFYQSNVRFQHCEFIGNRSEDGLNIIRSSFEISDCLFYNTQSDAFDGDFIQGTVKNTTFKKLGNDAIDVSGSNIIVQNCTIEEAADKGLSAGENSTITASDLKIFNSEIAVASKDNSTITVEGLQIDNCSVGFTVFQKKPEFGPATVIATRVLSKGLQKLGLNETNSTLTINGKDIAPIEGKVEDVLYGAEFGVKTVR